VIGALCFSVLLSLIATPVVFCAMQSFETRARARSSG